MQTFSQRVVTDKEAFPANLQLFPTLLLSKKINISIETLIHLLSTYRAALTSFLNYQFRKYDALVGENCCQIRAAVLMDFINLLKQEPSFRTALQVVCLHLEQIMHVLATMQITAEDRQHALPQFFIKHQLTFEITQPFLSHIKFIIFAYCLTLTKQSLPTVTLTLLERVSYEPLIAMGFTRTQAKLLVPDMQQYLSAASCAYIQQEAKFLKHKGLWRLLIVKYDSYRRHVLPQFLVAKILFQRMLAKNYHIKIQIKRYKQDTPHDMMHLYFKPNEQQTDFEWYHSSPSTHQPYLVIAGACVADNGIPSQACFLKTFLSHSLLDILLANFAMHPQYPGILRRTHDLNILLGQDAQATQIDTTLRSQMEAIRNDYELKKHYAKMVGLCLENPSVFFLYHVYCDYL